MVSDLLSVAWSDRMTIYARIYDGEVAELFTPAAGVPIGECLHPDGAGVVLTTMFPFVSSIGSEVPSQHFRASAVSVMPVISHPQHFLNGALPFMPSRARGEARGQSRGSKTGQRRRRVRRIGTDKVRRQT
jgi:hypothetical protein